MRSGHHEQKVRMGRGTYGVLCLPKRTGEGTGSRYGPRRSKCYRPCWLRSGKARLMVTYGDDVWLCACGCGRVIAERHYTYNGKTTRRRPQWLRGHRARAMDAVKAASIFQAICAYKIRHKLTWRQMDILLGYAPSNTTGRYRAHLSATRSLVTSGRETMSRALATRHLRRLAGLPTDPTPYERRVALRIDAHPENICLTPEDRTLLDRIFH